MGELSWLIELAKYVGFPALIFAVWYIYHNAQIKQSKEQIDKFHIIINQAITAQKELNEIQFNTFRQAIERTIDMQDDEARRMFELVKDMTETEQYQSAIMSRIETKINNLDLYKIIKDITKELRGQNES